MPTLGYSEGKLGKGDAVLAFEVDVGANSGAVIFDCVVDAARCSLSLSLPRLAIAARWMSAWCVPHPLPRAGYLSLPWLAFILFYTAGGAEELLFVIDEESTLYTIDEDDEGGRPKIACIWKMAVEDNEVERRCQKKKKKEKKERQKKYRHRRSSLGKNSLATDRKISH